MAYPKITAFDARSFAKRLYENVRKPDGTPYAVFADDQFPPFAQSIRALRDAAAATDVLAHDVKGDIDDLRGNTASRFQTVDDRLAALEAQTSNPFP